MTTTAPATADHAALICALLNRFRLSVSTEAALSADVLRALGLDGSRTIEVEYQLGHGHGRIDFYLPDDQIGLELKVQGGTAAITRQLHRYCQSAKLKALILVTTNPLHTRLPETINRVRVYTVLTSKGWA